MMKIQIRERNPEVTEVLREPMWNAGSASRWAGSESGLDDKRCQIDVGLRPQSVRVEDTDADLFAAVDHAADRVSRSVARALERELEWDEGLSRSRTSGGSGT